MGGIAVFFTNCGRTGFQSDLSSMGKLETEVVTIEPEDQNPAIETKNTITTSYEPLLADRRYIKSVFNDVFGPTSDSVDATRAHLNALEHGSPCSVYADHSAPNSSGVYARADAMETCSRTTLSRTVAVVNPKPTVSRQALLSKACSDLVSNDTTLAVAMKKISSEAVPASTRANVRKAFRLFYRMRNDPHEGLLDSLQVMVPATGATKENWRQVINAVCASGLWEVM
jgi:hypothetical protein